MLGSISFSMAWTLSTSQAILLKAGANFNSTAGTSGALLSKISDLAEGMFCRDTKYNWVSNATLINAPSRNAIESDVANLGAKFLIEHDMSGYTSLGEAITMVNILLDDYSKSIPIWKLSDVQAWARGEG